MRFSEPCRQALEAANREAQRLGQSAVGVGHLLLALLRDETCAATALLREVGVDPSRLRQSLGPRLPTEERADTVLLPAAFTMGGNRIENPGRAGQVVRLPQDTERLPQTAALEQSIEWALEEAGMIGPTRELLPGGTGPADVGTEHLLLGLLLQTEYLLSSLRLQVGGRRAKRSAAPEWMPSKEAGDASETLHR
jgi:ATP-dependent Clp protease ATP-binding subunit ClpA